MIAAARRILREMAPDVPPRFRTFEQIYAASLGERHFNLTLVAAFAGTALLLAVAGIYGVMLTRWRNGGAKLASASRWAATRGQVFRTSSGKGSSRPGAGVFLGVRGSGADAERSPDCCFGVTPTDPLTFISVIVTLDGRGPPRLLHPGAPAMTVEPIEACAKRNRAVSL